MSKSFIGALLLSIGLAGIFVFALPAYDALRASKQAVADRAQLLADTKDAQANLKRLIASYRDNEAELARVLLSVPRGPQADYLTSSIHEAARSAGTRLTNLSIAESAKSEDTPYQRVEIKGAITGRYQEFIQFMEALEHSLRLYDVGTLAVSRSASDASGGLVINFMLSAYHLP